MLCEKYSRKKAAPKVMSVALIESFDRWFLSLSRGSGTTLRQAQEPLVEMTATLNVVVLINSTTVMQTYWTAPFFILKLNLLPGLRRLLLNLLGKDIAAGRVHLHLCLQFLFQE